MWAEITVPSHWEMESFHSERGWGGYRRHFTVPDHPGRIKLRFEGVYSDATVWVNGHEVARHEGGATPFEVDVTDFVTPGDNLLALLVKEHSTTSDQLDHMSHYADFPLAGIFRPVYLLDVPPVHVGSLEITSSFDRAYRNAQLQVRVGVLNESSKAFQGEVELTLQGPSPGQAVVCRSKPIEVHIGPWQRLDREIVLPVEVPQIMGCRTPQPVHGFGPTAEQGPGCRQRDAAYGISPDRDPRIGDPGQWPADQVARHLSPRCPPPAWDGR